MDRPSIAPAIATAIVCKDNEVMRYPIAIEAGGDTYAFGVVVPDLPGCFSAGDTLDDAMTATMETVEAWMDATLAIGGAMPAPSTLESVRERFDHANWTFAIMDLADTTNTADGRRPI